MAGSLAFVVVLPVEGPIMLEIVECTTSMTISHVSAMGRDLAIFQWQQMPYSLGLKFPTIFAPFVVLASKSITLVYYLRRYNVPN